MRSPSYEQLLDFYYNFLEAEQIREAEEDELIDLLRALLDGYQSLADKIIELRETINNQSILLQKTGILKEGNPPFYDLYSDFQQDFSHFKAYRKYEKYLEYIVKSNL